MRNKIGTIKRALVTLGGDEGTQFPVQQVTMYGNPTLAEIITPYGVHANLPPESLMVVLPINNTSEYLVAMGGMPDERIPVEEGEVVFFHPLTKSKIHFKNDGSIEIEAPTTNHTGDINITGDVKIAGNLDVTGAITATDTVTATVDVIGGGISLKTHVHSGNNVNQSNTGPPV